MYLILGEFPFTFVSLIWFSINEFKVVEYIRWSIWYIQHSYPSGISSFVLFLVLVVKLLP